MTFIEVFFWGGGEKEGWSYGMPRCLCLQEIEVLDLVSTMDWQQKFGGR